MNVLVIGAGSIGSVVVKECQDMECVKTCFVMDRHRPNIKQLERRYKKVQPVSDLNYALKQVDLVVEAASQEAVKEYGLQALEAGAELVIMSVGALVDEGLRDALYSASGKNRIYLPTGALCGLDAVVNASHAGIEKVTLTTRKPPKSLNMEVDKNTVVFQGPAAEAVKRFPKNVNVAATLSLASAGFQKTEIKLVCDPDIDQNIHEIRFQGPAGELVGISRNVPSPDNPGTSYLAALSAAAAVRKLCSKVWIGI
ncbi:MAG: aspartate dehydrogenase [Thermoplasmata archaeon]